MSLPDNTIRHLDHSSFLLKYNGIAMIFDYFLDPAKTPDPGGLDNGVIDPALLADEQTYVFASHGHGDHYHPVIHTWREQIAHIQYILSYDIPSPPPEAVVVRPGEEKNVGALRVRGYPSTDDGLAYSIYLDGGHIYFSGDNAFWNWDGDLDDEIYHRIALAAIDRDTPMDIAFQVCDPRLDGMGDGGIHIFAHTFQPGLLVPIHSFGNYAFNQTVADRLRQRGYDKPFWCVSRKGDVCPLTLHK